MPVTSQHQPPFQRPRASVRRTRLVVAAVGLVTAAAGVGLAVPSTAAAPLHTDTGRVEAPSNGVFGAGELEFFATGCTEPLTQGLDTWVFELPPSLRGTGHTLTLRGSDPALSVGAYLYTASCGLDDTSLTPTAGASTADLDGTETWVAAYSPDPEVAIAGLDLVLEVTPTAGTTTSPTATATATVTATSTATTTTAPGGTRGTYGETPDDPLFTGDDIPVVVNPGQWGLRQVRAPQAWQLPRATGFGITVGVLDSGLDLQRGATPDVHPDFRCPGKVKLIAEADPDPDGTTVPHDDVEGHGTHVAGIIGACTDNGEGIAGVAPDSTLMPIQVLSGSTVDTVGDLARAIDDAVDNGAHVINMSLGFGATGHVGTVFSLEEDLVGFTGEVYQPIKDAITRAVAAGTVVVAAAGNDTSPLCGFPAIAAGVVCVGSTDARELNASYGNLPIAPADDEDGLGAALMAPGGFGQQAFCDGGENVISSYTRDVDAAEDDCDGKPGYRELAGTSMASPHVAGVAALVYDRLGGLRNEANGRRVIAAMLDTAKDLYAPGYDPASGYGLVDALAAVQSITVVEPTGTPTPTSTATATATSTPEPLGTTTTVTAPATTQATDAVALAATVVDEDGAPVSGATVAFELAGEGASLRSTAVTGADGTATTSATPTAAGSYRVTAAYAGLAGSYLASSGARDVTVAREDTTTTVSTAGSGSGRTVTARVSDADTSTAGVAGGTVVFYDRGEEVGRGTTDGTGSASIAAPPGSRGASSRFGATFLGDDDFAGSSAGEAPAAASPARTSGALL